MFKALKRYTRSATDGQHISDPSIKLRGPAAATQGSWSPGKNLPAPDPGNREAARYPHTFKVLPAGGSSSGPWRGSPATAAPSRLRALARSPRDIRLL